MKQVVQNARNGKLTVKEIPDPIVKPGHVLMASAVSVISAGAEEIAIELAGDLFLVLPCFDNRKILFS